MRTSCCFVPLKAVPIKIKAIKWMDYVKVGDARELAVATLSEFELKTHKRLVKNLCYGTNGLIENRL